MKYPIWKDLTLHLDNPRSKTPSRAKAAIFSAQGRSTVYLSAQLLKNILKYGRVVALAVKPEAA